MLTIRERQMTAMANARPGERVVAPCRPTWIEFRLLDPSDRPVPGEEYRVRLADGALMEGSLNEEGRVRFEGILAGQCQICFPAIDGGEWKRLER
jgi:hypothetical protein